ncbi:Delta(1)-pyrroline-2-carboxylate reductase [Ananas comosus]|uniref:Delta(1)-pyrroline-2-carboxylate reductase n=1 Tax=Ananas comosus TaxID=4615 RepID=A0A199V9F1_ANACO|nr:Delta(1)-pyrroline-2-carboxylate reductase [Ananas comosus]
MAATSPPPPPSLSKPFVYLDSPTLHSLLAPETLIPHLRSSLPSLSLSVHSPPASPSTPLLPASSLLLMPSWSTHPSLPYLGVKVVTSFPSAHGVAASYSLFHSLSGAPLAALDGTALTLLRTSAVSALAALALARPAPRATLVVLGAGALAPYLVAAHRSAHPSIDRVLLWNRSPHKAEALVQRLRAGSGAGAAAVAFERAESLDDAVAIGDIVSCATSSETPLVKGKLLKPGAHLDLVGSFTPSMRECDDEALKRGRVFVDFEVAMEEAGELVGAFERGVMSPADIAGTLIDLVGGSGGDAAAVLGRRSNDEITVFKLVGTAVVDILAAQLAYETYINS